jgi:hypothetical protein
MRVLFLSEGPIKEWRVIEMTAVILTERISGVGNM